MPNRLKKANPPVHPRYLEAFHNGSLNRITGQTLEILESCTLCPRKCGVNRLKNETGFCKTGSRARVCSFMPHYGEEPPISGKNGSGTIFFSHCNMSCQYCQNYEFSQLGVGREVNLEDLAGFMLQLQGLNCHNINLVTPTHVLPQVLGALNIAASWGLKIPIVYNTGGYELPRIIRLLDGIVDIYLPDMRYSDPANSLKYSSAPDYPGYNQLSIKEMHRQVGIAKMDNHGIIKSGLIIRHLVLPDNLAGTDKIMEFISGQVSKEAYISLMSQYSPYYKAPQFKELARRITYEEYEEAKEAMQKYGLYNGWIQESGGLERFAGINIKRNL